jgi:hypothetical protein
MANNNSQEQSSNPQAGNGETGQTLVLMAFMFIVLLAFVGIAVDVGFAFARSTQFAAAVDAGALAGVPELHQDGLVGADSRAAQFLAANGWPTETMSLPISSTSTLDPQGFPQYTLTATWPITFFFLHMIGIDAIQIERSATAAFYAQAEMYTPTGVERGAVRIANQFMFGPDFCTNQGDPVTPIWSVPGVANPTYVQTGGLYTYRIRIPEEYASDNGTTVVHVELFDPDTYNGSANLGNTATFSYTNAYIAGQPIGSPDSCLNCGCGSPAAGQACIIASGENVTHPYQRPYYLQRVDENWAASGGGCSAVPNDPNTNAVTTFELYYFNESGARFNVSRYTSDNRLSNRHLTDLLWVSPRSGHPIAPTAGAPSGVPTTPGDFGNFEVNINNMPAPDEYGFRYLYLEVQMTGGSAKNVWDLWAGPPANVVDLPPEVNDRTLAILNDTTGEAGNMGGVSIFALGRQPLRSYHQGTIKMPLAPIDTRMGGGTIYASIFDFDNGAQSPITFTIDTLAWMDFRLTANVVNHEPNPELVGTIIETACDDSSNCDNKWFSPQLRLGVPTRDHPTNPVAFYGGNLEAEYRMAGDSHTWALSITAGRPFLTR